MLIQSDRSYSFFLLQLGELVPALKLRMSDGNKNLVVQALGLLGKVAKAVGKPIERQGKQALEPALRNLHDIKPNVRAAVGEMMDAWASVAGYDSLIAEVSHTYFKPG